MSLCLYYVVECFIFYPTGETVEPTKVNDTTMLFSDIVGFTAICSSCKPMMVVNMLNALYTQFDTFCGILDVYKVSDLTKV